MNKALLMVSVALWSIAIGLKEEDALDMAFLTLLAEDKDTSCHRAYRFDWAGAKTVKGVRTYDAARLKILAADYAELAAGSGA